MTRWRPLELPPLSSEAAARLAGWVDHLDVDLALAQTTLRLPADRLPPVPQPDTVAPAPADRRAASRTGAGPARRLRSTRRRPLNPTAAAC